MSENQSGVEPGGTPEVTQGQSTQQKQFVTGRWQAPFFTIWTVQALSLLGSQLVQFALIWYLTIETGSATVLAIATLVGLGPQVLIGPIAGTLVDRWNRRLVMIGADALVALSTLGLALLFAVAEVQIWHIYLLMFLRSLAGSFHWPAMTASTSLMVPREHLARIQGLNQLLQGGLTVVSAPIGALLISAFPIQGILAIDVVTAVIAIVPLTFIAVPQPKKTEHAGFPASSSSVWGDLKAGLRYTAGWPGLLMLMALAALINMVLSVAMSLLPILVTQHFLGDALQLGWIESTAGIGMLIGGLLLSIWGGFKRRIFTSMLGLVLLGAAATMLGLVPAQMFPIAVGIAFVMGLSLPLVNGPVHAVLQAVVAPDMQGRVFTLLQSAATAMMPIGLLVAGPVADRYGVQVWFLVGGGITILAGVAGFVIPALRDIELQPAAASSSGEEAPLEASKTGLVAQPVPMEISSSD